MAEVIRALLDSEDPSVRYRALVEVCGLAADSALARQTQAAIPASTRVKRLLGFRNEEGRIAGNVYAKYTGAHWRLADLADMRYPAGDGVLEPIRDQVCEAWLSPQHVQERIIEREAPRYKSQPGVAVIEGRARRCASQEGNALYAIMALGLADARADQLAANLIRWQWPDGGWNCDRKTTASTSSFHESLLPMRGLAWHAKVTDSTASMQAVERCAEFFLSRRLFKRKRDGSIIRDSFLKLRYPHYWHYDILNALKVMVEAGYINDPRCADALDLLETKQLPNGGWRAEGKHYKAMDEPHHGGSVVEWGIVSRRKEMNLFVTLEALEVLKAAGRLPMTQAELLTLGEA